MAGILRLYAAASLKQPTHRLVVQAVRVYSAALCRGLIEACRNERYHHRANTCILGLYAAASLKRPTLEDFGAHPPGILRLYAAASLKHRDREHRRRRRQRYSAALCRGLIEASCSTGVRCPHVTYSAALCRGLIEARSHGWNSTRQPFRYSAALCRGLIEAPPCGSARGPPPRCILRLYAAASLKRRHAMSRVAVGSCVFCGFMPRPH